MLSGFLQKITPNAPGVGEYIANYIELLQLPVPDAGEYIKSNTGAIFFHPVAGISIRIERAEKKANLATHPLIADPLVSLHFKGGLTLEICEGLRTHDIKEDETRWLSKALWQDKIYWADGRSSYGRMRTENVGRHSLTSERFPAGLPIVMDREQVHTFYETPHFHFAHQIYYAIEHGVRKRFNHLAPPVTFMDVGVAPEDVAAYQAVRRSLDKTLTHAFARGINHPDAGAMRAFWAQCVELTAPSGETQAKPGALYRGWEYNHKAFGVDAKTRAASEAAYALAQRYKSQKGLTIIAGSP